jgi:tetratricopeptide (TPR) repeat protein
LTLSSRGNLAYTYRIVGRVNDAIALLEETLTLQRAKLPTGHRDTLATLNHLAYTYLAAGRTAEAVPLAEQTLNLRKAHLGLVHVDTLVSMNTLAAAYQATGRVYEAVPLLQQALERTTETKGKEHPATLASMNNLAGAYRATGRLADASPLIEKVYLLTKSTVGPEHPNTLIALRNLGTASLQEKRAERGRQMLRDWRTAQRKRLVDDKALFAGLLAELGRDLLKLGEVQEAEDVLRECVDLREQCEPDAWTTYETTSLLGIALAMQKRHVAAEPLLVSGYHGMKDRQAKIPPAQRMHLKAAADRVARLYDAWGKPGEAKNWRTEAAGTQARNGTPKLSKTADSNRRAPQPPEP